MGLGAPALNTSQKTGSSGGGGSVTGASEGLSLDGTIVQLGRLAGDTGLTSLIGEIREIPFTNGSGSIHLVNDPDDGFLSVLFPGGIELSGDATQNSVGFGLADSASGNQYNLGIDANGNLVTTVADGDGLVLFPSGNIAIGDTSTIPDEGSHILQVYGPGIMIADSGISGFGGQMDFGDLADSSLQTMVFVSDRFVIGNATGPSSLQQFKSSGNWRIGGFADTDETAYLLQVSGQAIFNTASVNSSVAIEDFGNIVIRTDDWNSGSPALQIIQQVDGTAFQVEGGFDGGGDPQGVLVYTNQTTGKGSSQRFNKLGQIVMDFGHPAIFDTTADLSIRGSLSTGPLVNGGQGVWLLGDFDNSPAVPTLRLGVNVGGVDYWIPAEVA